MMTALSEMTDCLRAEASSVLVRLIDKMRELIPMKRYMTISEERLLGQSR